MNNSLEKAKELRKAILEGDNILFSEIAKPNTDIILMMTPFGTWLHVASSAGNIYAVKALVRLGVDINAKGGTLQGNALNTASSGGYLDIVKYLLECGIEIDISEPSRNPLFGAIYGGNIEIVKTLIDEGIDTSITYFGENMTDMSAKDFAIERGQLEIAQLLN